VPRVLVVGCGCRGQELARALAAAGHPVRGTTRDPTRCVAIAAAGAEPSRPSTRCLASSAIMPAASPTVTLFQHSAAMEVIVTSVIPQVTAVVWLLGLADSPELHAGRLRMLCEKIVDTPVRGLVYEASTRFPGGRDIVADAAQRWLIPTVVVEPGTDSPSLLAALDSLEILQSR